MHTTFIKLPFIILLFPNKQNLYIFPLKNNYLLECHRKCTPIIFCETTFEIIVIIILNIGQFCSPRYLCSMLLSSLLCLYPLFYLKWRNVTNKTLGIKSIIISIFTLIHTCLILQALYYVVLIALEIFLAILRVIVFVLYYILHSYVFYSFLHWSLSK